MTEGVPGRRRGPDRGDQTGPRYVRELGLWTMPFIMAAINTRVVRRSNALLQASWGARTPRASCGCNVQLRIGSWAISGDEQCRVAREVDEEAGSE